MCGRYALYGPQSRYREQLAEIHDRMPVIVHPKDYVRWLDPAFDDVAELQEMIGPYPDRLMEAYPVSRKLNSPASDGPELVEREFLP